MAKYNGSLSKYPQSRHGKCKNGKHEEVQDKLLGLRVMCKGVKENLIKPIGLCPKAWHRAALQTFH